ncbi:tyrosine--tRNA ligase [bacterium]|nr:tyrosine--tRNA ligase [candidate division CSSED10-310 bacterium]
MPSLIKNLEERGFIYQISDPDLDTFLETNNTSCYAGFDPSAGSLTIGHLIPIIGLMHMQNSGNRPIAVVGGATGMIGDPSGKDQERSLLSIETLRQNEAAVKKQLSKFLDFDSKTCGALLVNNYDWTGNYKYLDFLRDIGKHFSVNAMIAKESVKIRLESRDQGISYTEFSYQILQAYDFHHLWKTYGCRIQIGGSDQWGNITAGIDLNRRLGGEQLYGITFPLIMTADGKKIGKSEGNAIWLDENLTKPYVLYQYFIQADDRDVVRFLKLYTFLSMKDINDLEKCLEHEPEKREAQKVLAQEVTKLVHGERGLRAAESATRVLFGDEPIKNFDDDTLKAIFAETPSAWLPRNILTSGITLVELCVVSGFCKSKGEARRLITSGGLYCNNVRITEPDFMITKDQLASKSILILRSGKKRYFLIHLKD